MVEDAGEEKMLVIAWAVEYAADWMQHHYHQHLPASLGGDTGHGGRFW